MLERFKRHYDAGRECVLLYAGDHDPTGLQMSDFIRGNLYGLRRAVDEFGDPIGFDPGPHNLTIERFGLNADTIAELGLSWIPGLESGSGRDLSDPRHPDHDKPYVRRYLEKFGPRKCESNALVTRPEEGRRLCRNAILRHIDPAGVGEYEEYLRAERAEVLKAMPRAARRALREAGGKVR